jgi:hypothetical protein
MAAVTTADQIVREDLSDLYINIDQRQTPFLTRLKRGDDLENVKFFSWALERYAGRIITGVPENKDANNFETDTQTQLYGRSQKFWRQPHVTVEANTINRAPADFGKYNKQVIKKVQEQKRDIEQRLLSDADSRDDDGTTGREVQGVGRFVNDAVSVGSAGAALTFTDTQTTVPAAFRTPTAQIYVSTLYSTNASTGDRLDFKESTLNGMLQSRYDLFGKTNELSCFCDAIFRQHATRMFQNQQTLSGSTPIMRMQTPTSANWDGEGVFVIDTDFGPADINLVNRCHGKQAHLRSCIFPRHGIYVSEGKRPFLHTRTATGLGAGPRGLIQSILGPQWGDPQAHLKVDPANATGTY